MARKIESSLAEMGSIAWVLCIARHNGGGWDDSRGLVVADWYAVVMGGAQCAEKFFAVLEVVIAILGQRFLEHRF